MKYEVKYTSRFKKDFKSLQKSDADIQRFKKGVELLAKGSLCRRSFMIIN